MLDKAGANPYPTLSLVYVSLSAVCVRERLSCIPECVGVYVYVCVRAGSAAPGQGCIAEWEYRRHLP